jgi:MoaA/NifB/PqqE/SkfB family radical SAM enzyme
MSILNNYVCIVPFTYLEIHRNKVFGCCPSWMPEPYGDTNNIKNIWNDEQAVKTRESVLDGSYTYCDEKNCFYLSQLLHENYVSEVFIKKSDFRNIKGPQRLNLCFDRSCNLSCPSCRKDIIIANNKELEENQDILIQISKEFHDTVKTLYLSGSADPFASKTFKNLLINYDDKLFPNLTSIHLHTNGLLFDEEMWNKMSKVHKFISSFEVSIDAGTEDTYKKVRGGNWEKLISNLNFINSIDRMTDKKYSFVVQDINYKEMLTFYNLIFELKKNNYPAKVYFNKILNWGTYTDDEYFQKQIWNEEHPYFNDYLEELKKISFKPYVSHDMNDIVEKYKLKPKPNKLI